MKFTFFLIALIVLGFLLHLVLPWWVIAPLAAILAGGLQLTPRQAFTAALVGGMLLWGGYAIYLDNGILSNRLGQLVGGLSPVWLFLLTSLIGGLLAAMGSVTGSLGRSILPAAGKNDLKTTKNQ